MNLHNNNYEEDEIDLRELFSIIRNNLGKLIFITLLVVVLASIYLYFAKPIYSSSVTIALDNQAENKLKNILPNDMFLDTKTKERLQLAKVTIQSKKFIKTIIDKVNIDKEYFLKTNFRKNEVNKFTDIKLNIKCKDDNLYGQFFEIIPINNNKFKLKIDINTEEFKFNYNKICKYNKKIDNKYFSLKVIKLNKKSPFIDSLESKIINLFHDKTITDLIEPRYYFRVFSKKSQIDTIVENMSVSDLSDSILKIEYRDNMPIQTKEVVEEIAKSYIEYTLENRTSELEQTLEFLDKQIIDIQSNLKRRGSELKKYQQKSGSAIISIEEDILKTLEKKKELIDKIVLQIQEIKRFKSNLTNGIVSTVSLMSMGIDTTSIQSLIEGYRKDGQEIEALKFQEQNIGKAVTKNKQINMLIDELKNKELYIQELLLNFTYEHPQVIEAKTEIDNLKNKIHATIMANIQKLEKSRIIARSTILNNVNMVENNLNNRLRLLKSNIREKKALLQSIPEKHMINENLKRKFALSAEIYTFLLQKKIEVEISKASVIANTKILEDAYIAEKPIKPKKKLILVISLIVGFILGVFYIFIKEFFDTKIRSVKDVEKLTDIPLYGILPLNNNERFFKEALRNIRTNLQFVIADNKECINILISSTVAGEGKTTITAGLAEVISQADKKVLVMDLDLRKPRLYKELKRSNKIGMSNYLTKNYELHDVIQTINENLDFLPAGSIPPNPSELFMNKRFDKTIKELEERYDYIIFDSAPIGTVTDSSLILKYSDILLLIVKVNMTENLFLENFNKMIKEKSIKSSGIVLNGVKLFKNKNYGYGYGYGYDYGYGYKKVK
jgi:capsular exopolysaccharide synthesis family protein